MSKGSPLNTPACKEASPTDVGRTAVEARLRLRTEMQRARMDSGRMAFNDTNLRTHGFLGRPL